VQFDRARQRLLMQTLAEIYPRRATVQSVQDICEADDDTVLAEICYLHEHGLVDCKLFDFADGRMAFGPPKITAAGIDFMADDGGLTAIRNTVTVRLHQDDLRQLLLRKVDQANLPEGDRSRLRAAIGQLPAKALEQVATRAVQEGLDRVPDATGWLRSLLGL
jgi:hypothetical protein